MNDATIKAALKSIDDAWTKLDKASEMSDSHQQQRFVSRAIDDLKLAIQTMESL